VGWTQRRVVVTGGASFIGSHLVEALLRAGARVRVLDDLSSGRLSNLAAVSPDIELQVGDLRYLDFAIRALEDCDTVFHLAAAHGGRGYIATHPADCAGNMALDAIVFEAALRNRIEHVTFASSACVYPTHLQRNPVLLKEEMVSFGQRGGAFADEEYGWAKLMGELSLAAYHKQHGIGAAVARISSAYGPRENESHAVSSLIAKAAIRQSPYQIWGSGEQTRGFTYVTDVVSGLVRAAERIQDATAVNVGSDEFIPVRRVAEEIFRIVGWSPPDGIATQPGRPVGVRHRALDGSLARELLGWAPEMPLAKGLEASIAWYQAYRDVTEVAERLDTLLYERTPSSPG